METTVMTSVIYLLSPQDLSPITIELCENLNLPPYVEDHEMECNSCGPLLYLDDLKGNIVLCNLTTKQLKLLPPPDLETPLRKASFDGSGLGYDSKSDDYKVIRNYCKKKEFSKLNTELYSLKSGCWKTIPSPDAYIEGEGSVYVSGRYYWVASLGKSFGGPSSKSRCDILSFDFTTESFDCLRRPPCSEYLDLAFHLVEYYGLLGAIGFEKEGISSKVFELWVREETSWAKVFDILLSGLGLKDGRWLFLEGKSCYKLSQLLVYDLIGKECKELGYDYPYEMKVTFCVESQFALPDARPMERSYADEEEMNEDSEDDRHG